MIEDQITRIQEQPPVGLISVGLAVTLWLASSLFLAVIDAMNAIYGVAETRPFWKLRLTAIVMTMVQAVILVGSLVAIVAWPLIVPWIGLSRAGGLPGHARPVGGRLGDGPARASPWPSTSAPTPSSTGSGSPRAA